MAPVEWTIVTVIIALVGLGAAVIRPIASLTGSITKLTVVVERLEKELTHLGDSNHESHKRLWDHNTEQDERIEDHERRIGALEHK